MRETLENLKNNPLEGSKKAILGTVLPGIVGIIFGSVMILPGELLVKIILGRGLFSPTLFFIFLTLGLFIGFVSKSIIKTIKIFVPHDTLLNGVDKVYDKFNYHYGSFRLLPFILTIRFYDFLYYVTYKVMYFFNTTNKKYEKINLNSKRDIREMLFDGRKSNSKQVPSHPKLFRRIIAPFMSTKYLAKMEYHNLIRDGGSVPTSVKDSIKKYKKENRINEIKEINEGEWYNSIKNIDGEAIDFMDDWAVEFIRSSATLGILAGTGWLGMGLFPIVSDFIDRVQIPLLMGESQKNIIIYISKLNLFAVSYQGTPAILEFGGGVTIILGVILILSCLLAFFYLFALKRNELKSKCRKHVEER